MCGISTWSAATPMQNKKPENEQFGVEAERASRHHPRALHPTHTKNRKKNEKENWSKFYDKTYKINPKIFLINRNYTEKS